MDPTTNRINTIAKGILSHPSVVTFADYFNGGKLRICAGSFKLRHLLFERLAVFGCAVVVVRVTHAGGRLPRVPLYLPPFRVVYGRRRLDSARRTDWSRIVDSGPDFHYVAAFQSVKR